MGNLPERKEGDIDVGRGQDNLIIDYSDYADPKKRRKMLKKADESSSKRSDILFYLGIAILLIVFGSLFAIGYYKSHKRILTIEELHDKNFAGKLSKDMGYIYKGAYSFVKQDGFWYTALLSQSGKSQYNFAFRYSPRELEDVPLRGALNDALFNSAAEYYLTFNPIAQNLSYTVLAANDLNQHMLNVFKKAPIASCDRNETLACQSRPIITCENTEDVVIYLKDSPSPSVSLSGNCIIITGEGFDQVKAVDRLLYHFYTIME